jgi:hypothetical protein
MNLQRGLSPKEKRALAERYAESVCDTRTFPMKDDDRIDIADHYLAGLNEGRREADRIEADARDDRKERLRLRSMLSTVRIHLKQVKDENLRLKQRLSRMQNSEFKQPNCICESAPFATVHQLGCPQMA